jgi:hypothetical protein
MMRFFSSCLLSLMAIWFSFHDFNIWFLVFFFIVFTYFSILIFYYYVSLKYHVFLFIGDLDYVVHKKYVGLGCRYIGENGSRSALATISDQIYIVKCSRDISIS